MLVLRRVFVAVLWLPVSSAAAIRGSARGGDPAAGVYAYQRAPQGGGQGVGGAGAAGGMPALPSGLGSLGARGANGGISYGNAEGGVDVSPAKTNPRGALLPVRVKDSEVAAMSEQFQSVPCRPP